MSRRTASLVVLTVVTAALAACATPTAPSQGCVTGVSTGSTCH